MRRVASEGVKHDDESDKEGSGTREDKIRGQNMEERVGESHTYT